MTNELISIRLSSLLGFYGVGAIVRGANGLVVVQDTRQWTDRQGLSAGKLIPYVERVRAALGIEEQLCEPPVAKELANGQVDGACVPATRFPSWMNCPVCGAMYRWPWLKDQPNYGADPIEGSVAPPRHDDAQPNSEDQSHAHSRPHQQDRVPESIGQNARDLLRRNE